MKQSRQLEIFYEFLEFVQINNLEKVLKFNNQIKESLTVTKVHKKVDEEFPALVSEEELSKAMQLTQASEQLSDLQTLQICNQFNSIDGDIALKQESFGSIWPQHNMQLAVTA